MINEHSVEIKASIEKVFKEIVLWGESKWWPKDCLMKFINLRSEIDVGTIYLQKVKLLFGPRWRVKIIEIKDLERVRRVFLDGMFCGYEAVSIKEHGQNILVTYKMDYTMRGFLNKLMWKLIFNKLHDRNIMDVLAAMKDYLEKSAV